MSSTATGNLPPALEPIRAYLARAQELQRSSVTVSHVLRKFAMQVGMTMRERLPVAEIQYRTLTSCS